MYNSHFQLMIYYSTLLFQFTVLSSIDIDILMLTETLN